MAARGGTPVFVVPSPEDEGVLRRLDDASVAARPDVYFPVLHGTYGEDGTDPGPAGAGGRALRGLRHRGLRRPPWTRC